jgi:hypothetical protein
MLVQCCVRAFVLLQKRYKDCVCMLVIKILSAEVLITVFTQMKNLVFSLNVVLKYVIT